MSDLDVIKEIESIIGEKLKPCTPDVDIMSYNQKGSYLLNEQQQITGLNLWSCELTNCDFLKTLSNLTQLNLSENKISDISVLKALPNLTQLNLSENKISDISVLKALPNLTYLDLSQNNLSDLSVLKDLPNLTHLDLRQNNLSDLSVLKDLPNLTQLNLSHNNLSDISVLKELKKLTNISLALNKISNIEALKNLNNIENICLGENQLKILPEWLLKLNLNIICETVGVRVWSGNNDKGVFLEQNPLEKPPLEIIKQGNEAIRTYFEQIRKEGFDTIYEAKLILVGEGGAGKTSLTNKIINPAWQLIPETKSESTKGIDILSYEFPYNGKTFRVNIWDFGGQEIYHQTHQFFLSKRALYFLLTDDRKEDTDFYHWLNIVDLLSANSPVLIIKNEKSNRSRSIPERQLKAEFGNIKDILATDLNDNRGLPEIVKALQHYITDLPHIGSPLPRTWVKVRQQLEQDPRYHIELKEYFAICQANGFEKEADKLQLSEYLHDLGVCLHFQNHPLLLKTLILKPTWATDAVYKVLDNDKVKQQAGHFNDHDLADIWQDEQYCTMRGELLALMQKFKLCYEIRNQPQHYIAPQLLEENPPAYPWETENNLLLRYQYDFMPKGILSQFIVEMHEYITNDYQSVWKSGVILKNDNSQAEIIEYYGKREIHIRVNGQHKRNLLHDVSYELDKINNSYDRLKDKCKKLIPCHCEKCSNTSEPHFYDYAELKERVSHRRYDIECRKPPYNKVDILKLVEDIEIQKIKMNLEI
jgi:small GTP-binding protein